MTIQPLKEQVSITIQNIAGRELSESEQTTVDELFMQLIGNHNAHTDDMPTTWSFDQRKYYVNFRNTLRREQFIKYWYGMK